MTYRLLVQVLDGYGELHYDNEVREFDSRDEAMDVAKFVAATAESAQPQLPDDDDEEVEIPPLCGYTDPFGGPCINEGGHDGPHRDGSNQWR